MKAADVKAARTKREKTSPALKSSAEVPKSAEASKKGSPKVSGDGAGTPSKNSAAKAGASKAGASKASASKAGASKASASKAGAGEKPAKTGKAPDAGAEEKAVGSGAPGAASKTTAGASKTTKKVVASKTVPAPVAPESEARKGITVVAKKQSRRSRPAVAGTYMLPSGGFKTLGATFGKPLIPSGPGAVPPSSLAMSGDGAKKKSPFNKRELAKFRRILEEKRDELSGAVSNLDVQTQRTGSSETSKSQALDDQGSEAADQALSLDLVAAERRLLSEIVAAIRRIDEGTYGICELTGKPIRVERLEELPWTRYSIDAARELERRQLRT